LAKRPLVPPSDLDEAQRINWRLGDYERDVQILPGLESTYAREVLVAQIIESARRNRYVARLLTSTLSPRALDPLSGAFDPLKGAVILSRDGDHDEACWLVLLSVHLGRHRRFGWNYVAYFYGKLGEGGLWDWPSVQGGVGDVRDWLDRNKETIRSGDGGFGNHRKYESLEGWTPMGTGAVIATYVDWVAGSHRDRFDDAIGASGDPTARFASLFRSLSSVARFGRTARFDYLTMLGKLSLANVTADSVHLAGATGPLSAARLLLDGSRTSTKHTGRELEATLGPLREYLDISNDVFEDALCNWQKSPSSFVPFRG